MERNTALEKGGWQETLRIYISNNIYTFKTITTYFSQTYVASPSLKVTKAFPSFSGHVVSGV